jgi:formylglycine-generating enzyme required for sulfatase activity
MNILEHTCQQRLKQSSILGLANKTIVHYLNDSVSIQLLKIPAGIYEMDYNLKGKQKTHLVALPEFYITDLINAEVWNLVATEVDKLNVELPNFSQPTDPLNVTLESAIEFSNRLEMLTGIAYQLPTEMLWAYSSTQYSKSPKGQPCWEWTADDWHVSFEHAPNTYHPFVTLY